MECTGNCVQIEEFNETTYEMAENAATLRARIAELEAKARRLNRVRQQIMQWHDLIESEQDLDDSAGDGISVRDVLLKEMEDAAAIDAATEGE